MKNSAEDFAGTNPLDSSSLLRILSLSGGNLLTWSSVSNKTYRVLAIPDLLSNFVPISGLTTASASTTSYLDTSATNSRKFYRVTTPSYL